MRHIYLYVLLIISPSLSYGQAAQESLPSTEHLVEINKQWTGIQAPILEEISFEDDNARISYHLQQVITRLNANPHANPEIQARRSVLISTLKTYAEYGQFPINTHHSVRTPYFIDDYGTACAVGHLMIESGHEDLALLIKKEHNYDFIADITTEGVTDWAQQFGFSLDELALIQPAYPPDNHLTAIGDGANGPITFMLAMPDGRLYLSGDFDELDGSVSCSSGLGYYEDGTFYCLSDGPSGTIINLERSTGDEMMVVGQLNHNGNQYAAAMYQGDEWTYYSIPDRPGAIGKSISRNYDEYSRYVIAIDPQDGSTNNEVWRYNSTGAGTWHKVITCNGEVNCSSNPYYNYVAGGFDAYTDHLADDAIISCDGLVKLELQSFSIDETIPVSSTFLPDTIQSLFLANDVLYIAGTCDNSFPNTYLSRFQNGVVQPLIYHEEDWGQDHLGFYDVASAGGNQLYVAGDYRIDNALVLGNNIGVYNLLYGSLESVALLDGPVRRVSTYNDEVYIAGDFTNNVGVPMPHIAKIASTVGLHEYRAIEASASPNPAINYINLSWDTSEHNYRSLQIIDMLGKAYELNVQSNVTGVQVDISALSKGAYVYHIETAKGLISGSFIKD